jgi:hypothetical protein
MSAVLNKHTPGPWTAAPGSEGTWTICHRRVYAVSANYLLARVYPTGSSEYSPDYPQAEANARLIAAAPDLLDALKSARATYAAIGDTYGSMALGPLETRLLEIVDAALAKAESRS